MSKGYLRVVQDAPLENTFKTSSGEIKNLTELKNILAEKGNAFYREFVDDKQNHFANWVENIFDDKELAASLRKTHTVEEAIDLIDSKIKYAELWLKFNSKKELLHEYLANGPLSLKNMLGAQEYEPSYHTYENKCSYTLPAEPKQNLPELKKPEMPKPEKKEQSQRKELKPPVFDAFESSNDHELLMYLETLYPQDTPPEPTKEKMTITQWLNYYFRRFE